MNQRRVGPGTNYLGDVYRILAEIDHSSRSNTKYSHLESVIAGILQLEPKDVYIAHVSKSGNVSVRFGQSPRAQNAKILIATTTENGDPDEITQAVMRYKVKNSLDAEGLVFFEYDTGLWTLYSAVVESRPTPPITIPLLVENFDDIKLALVTEEPPPIDEKMSTAGQTKVRFVVIERYGQLPEGPFPLVVLERDNWDDYGFRTLFRVRIYSTPHQYVDAGTVKVLRKGQEGDATRMPEGVFATLSDEYASLGQSYSYYEELHKLEGGGLGKAILRGLRDVVLTSSIRDNFETEPGFQRSLMRMGTAERALEDAPALFRARKKQASQSDHGLKFKFLTNTGGNNFTVDFEFNRSEWLPDRINAIIGYNGTGKTQLLANLAFVALGDRWQRESRSDAYGYIDSADTVRFSSVIAISYSAFDTFRLPRSDSSVLETQEDQGVFGYSYFGLRAAYTYDDDPFLEGPATWSLKSTNDITEEFASALEEARRRDKRPILSHALHALGADPSFGRIGINIGDVVSQYTWEFRHRFDALSTGHKIVINILVQIVAGAQPGSLILIDEPESHLHPSLLAAFLKALNIILVHYESYAILTTHSPVIVQEIPRRYVRVLKRMGSQTRVEEPTEETFGANIGTLTRSVFNLDSSQADFHSVLERLASEMSIAAIDDLFDGEMSDQARAYVMALKRGGVSS